MTRTGAIHKNRPPLWMSQVDVILSEAVILNKADILSDVVILNDVVVLSVAVILSEAKNLPGGDLISKHSLY